MEFIDEESRPRFVLHSRSAPASSTAVVKSSNKLHTAACIAGSAILFSIAFHFYQSQILSPLLFWFAISLLIAPFAPAPITGGDIRVGIGEILPPPPPAAEDREEPRKRGSRIKPKRPEDLTVGFAPPIGEEKMNGISSREKESRSDEITETEWNDQDFEILKKQMAKYPVGAPGRWEKITEAFQGRHGVESVIQEAKSLAQKKPSDSFGDFMRQRKNQDKRFEAVIPEFPESNGADLNGAGTATWSNGEDIALLNALKAFPKEVPLRWEKIAAAVSSKSKAECMKRISELKKDFRNSKAS